MQYVLRFFFDPGSGICLWAGNDAARERFDYPVELDLLPLSDATKAAAAELVARFDTSLDWNDPLGPGMWSREEEEDFAAAARRLVETLRAELGPAFVIRNEME